MKIRSVSGNFPFHLLSDRARGFRGIKSQVRTVWRPGHVADVAFQIQQLLGAGAVGLCDEEFAKIGISQPLAIGRPCRSFSGEVADAAGGSAENWQAAQRSARRCALPIDKKKL